MAAKGKVTWRQRIGQTLYVWQRLLPYLATFRWRLTAAFGMTVIVVLAELAKPWPLKIIVDQITGDQPLAILPAWLTKDPGSLALAAGAAVLVFSLITGISSYFRDLWLAEIGRAHV